MSACDPPTPPPEVGPAALSEAVRQCRRAPRFLTELRELYEEIGPLAQRAGARCLGGGGCCKFDLAGHRLYLTTGELALLVERPPADFTPRCHGPTSAEDRGGSRRCHASAPFAEACACCSPKHASPEDGEAWHRRTVAPRIANPPMRCPYQRRGRCLAYDRRPLGCRVYFCRVAPSDWCGGVYEEYHRKVARLHERFDLPYLYVELTSALAECLALGDVASHP